MHLTSDRGGAESAKVRPDRILWVGYRVGCPDQLDPAVWSAMEGPFALWFGSPSAVQNFSTLAPGAIDRAAIVWAHGATTVREVLGHGVTAFPRRFDVGP